MARISDKKTFLRLWSSGKLGNRLRTWDTVEDLLASGYKGLVSLRGKRPDAKIVRTHKTVDEIVTIAASYDPRDYFLGESAPDERLLIQGEFGSSAIVGGGSSGYVLSYSLAQCPMRVALANARHEYSPSAITAILKGYMDGNSWEDFSFLREEYPDAQIEFGVYDCFLGNLPARNTIIWEVRNY